MTLAELNAAPPEVAMRELARCCGSTEWGRRMTAARPFESRERLYEQAAVIWLSLPESDWREAFGHHPRIGERVSGWAAGEQSGTAGASGDTVRKLAARNADYERRFGHVFLICATGKSATEMLGQLEQRMTNDPSHELRVAAAEQLKITRLRLEKLLDPQPVSTP